MPDLNEKIEPGQPFSASLWSALVRIARRVSNIKVAAPLTMQEGPGGITLGIVVPPGGIWAKITSGHNPYSWVQQIPQSGGGWTGGTLSGTNAIEVNGNVSVPANAFVRMDVSRGPKAAVFIYSKCS